MKNINPIRLEFLFLLIGISLSGMEKNKKTITRSYYIKNGIKFESYGCIVPITFKYYDDLIQKGTIDLINNTIHFDAPGNNDITYPTEIKKYEEKGNLFFIKTIHHSKNSKESNHCTECSFYNRIQIKEDTINNMCKNFFHQHKYFNKTLAFKKGICISVCDGNSKGKLMFCRTINHSNKDFYSAYCNIYKDYIDMRKNLPKNKSNVPRYNAQTWINPKFVYETWKKAFEENS